MTDKKGAIKQYHTYDYDYAYDGPNEAYFLMIFLLEKHNSWCVKII